MKNPNAIRMAQYIAETFAPMLVDREQNVVTLETTDGKRFLVTVETMFEPTDTSPLPDPAT